MTRYTTGVSKEQRAKKELEQDGFIVTRAAGSHGIFDLVGVNPRTKEVRCIQVKVAKRPKSFALELDELAGACPRGKYDVSAWLYVWTSGGKDWTRRELAT